MKMEHENGLLKVDEAVYNPSLPGRVVVRIDEALYMLRGFNNARNLAESDLMPYKSTINEKWRRPAGYEYIMHGIMPRAGFEVELGRPITAAELKKIVKEYGLGDDTISGEFADTKGSIYGDKYAKKYVSLQVKVNADQAIPLERKLQSEGIQANSTSPGRVNIRTDWGGAREGSGRKPSGKRLARIYVTEEEEKKLREYLEAIRLSKEE